MKTTLAHNNFSVIATADGVQVAFSKRIPSPVMNYEEAKLLARMILTAAQDHSKFEKERR